MNKLMVVTLKWRHLNPKETMYSMMFLSESNKTETVMETPIPLMHRKSGTASIGVKYSSLRQHLMPDEIITLLKRHYREM